MNAMEVSWPFVRSRAARIGGMIAVLGCSIVAGSRAGARAATPQSIPLGRTSALGTRSWAYAQRAYPLAEVPPGARMRAWREIQDLERHQPRRRAEEAA